MAGQTLNRFYPYPTGTDANDVPFRMQALAEAIDADMKNVAAVTPHVKYRNTATLALTAATWTRVPWGAQTETTGLQPWTPASDYITISETGIYAVSTYVSLNGSDFAVQIFNIALGIALGQTPIGQGASQSSGLSLTTRLVAGTQIASRVYAATARSLQPDAATVPCHMTLTKISAA